MTEDVSTAASPLDRKAVWSLVLGLVAVFGLFPLIQLPAAVAGIIAGVPALKSSKRGLAIAGIALSVLGLVVMTWIVVALFDAVRHIGLQELLRQLGAD